MSFQLSDLNQFSGGDHIYRHNLVRKVKYTEGVQYLAEHAGAYWLLDIVATNQIDPKFMAEEFQVWELVVKDGRATLTASDGNDKEIHRQDIDFTDFPEPGIKLYFTDNTILLPGEY